MLPGCSSINQKSCECLKKFSRKNSIFLFILFFQLESAVNRFPGCQQLLDDWTKHKVHLFERVSKSVNGWHVTRQPGNDPSGSSKDWASRFLFFCFFNLLVRARKPLPLSLILQCLLCLCSCYRDHRLKGRGEKKKSGLTPLESYHKNRDEVRPVCKTLRRLMGKKLKVKF